LLSATSFVCAYFLMFTNPVAAALLAWLVSMTSRQAGHFFFEPKGYDQVNHATHEHKEDIKVGYNLKRKIVLMAIWAAAPVFRLFPDATGSDFVQHLGQVWLAVGLGGLVFRTIHLFFIKDVQTGLVWATKIITDPFHDIKLYYKAPLALLRGELIDPHHARHGALETSLSTRDA
jgi:hypothetical protein